MSENRRNIFTAKRIALDAVLIAIYVILAMLGEHLEIAGVRITFSTLPILITAILFGAADSMLVGFLGEFITQMIAWGFSWSSLLWCAPHTLYGLLMGLFALMLPKYFSADTIENVFSQENNRKSRNVIIFYILCIVGAIFDSVVNTFVYYIDSVVNHYYSFAIVFGVMWVRIVVGIVTAIVIGTISAPLVVALKRNNLANIRMR